MVVASVDAVVSTVRRDLSKSSNSMGQMHKPWPANSIANTFPTSRPRSVSIEIALLDIITHQFIVIQPKLAIFLAGPYKQAEHIIPSHMRSGALAVQFGFSLDDNLRYVILQHLVRNRNITQPASEDNRKMDMKHDSMAMCTS
jgi:hypothetical protein